MFGWLAVVATAVAALLAPSASALLVPWTNPGWLGLTLVLAVVCTLLCFSAMNRWQPHVSATEAGLIYCLEPVFTALYVMFLPALLAVWTGVPYANQALTLTTVAGGGLITAANVILQLPQRRTTP